MKKIAIDSELQGLDFQHGSRPFLVTICEDGQEPVFWEWPIDPLTRQPVIEDVSDLHTIIGIINSADTIIGQNIKTESHALYHLCKDHGIIFNWPWEKTEDTLMAGHLLASNRKHDLTSMVTEYLHINMDSYEEAVKKASQKARRMARRDYPEWRIARKGEKDNPSAKDTFWHSDMWLPRCLATVNNYDKSHEWWTVTSEYANADSFFTYQLWEAMEKEIKKRQLWKIYRYRMRLLPIATGLERRGATINGVELQKMIREFGEEADRLGEVCENIAASYDYGLVLPKSGANNSLRQFCFGTEDEDGPLNLPVLKWTPSGQPSLDKEALEAYLVRLPRNSKQLLFVKSLRDKGKRDKAVTMMESYEKYWKPYTNGDGESNTGTTKINGDYQGWYVLYGSANPTGTDTLRWSFSNPNLANVCVDAETEYLTSDGWVKAPELTNDYAVAQYWKDTGEIDFVHPEIRVTNFVGQMRHITTENYIDLMVTPQHRCLLRNGKTKKTVDVVAEDFYNWYQHIHAGRYVGSQSMHLTKSEVTWICAVQADGSYRKDSKGSYGISFGFKKDRKIKRLLRALKDLDAEYSIRVSSKGATIIYVGKNEPAVLWAKELMPKKEFGPFLLDCDRETLDLFCSEVLLWDGYEHIKHAFLGNVTCAKYTSSIKNNADWVQLLWCLSGYRATLTVLPVEKLGPWAKNDHYCVSRVSKDCSETANHSNKEVPHNGPVYCVTVPSSYIVVRRNGRVSITGNSKQEGFNARRAFGPAPGREWWPMDAENLELRIPAFEAGEKDAIYVFEHPEEPPYFGSYHLLVLDLLYPHLFREYGKKVKTNAATASTYTRVKSGNFAVIYGCQKAKADATYGVDGAFWMMRHRFPNIAKLSDKLKAMADKLGYVTTIPDKSVDPARGYPILCTRTEFGRVMPTVPLNYFVQPTAMQWTNSAMIKCDEKLESWRQSRFDAFITLQVHDEIVFDFPRSQQHPKVDPKRSNLWRAKELQRLMMSCGDDIGVPTPVSISYCTSNWAELETL